MKNCSHSPTDFKPLRVCWHCLLAIESREGAQYSRAVYVDEDDPEESFCEWCKDDGFSVLYEL